MHERRYDIACVELIVRKKDGAAFALELDGEHVHITVDVDVPPVDADDFCALAEKYVQPHEHELSYERVVVNVRANRRPSGTKLLTFRKLGPESDPR